MAKVAKYIDKDLGYDEQKWFERYEKLPPTEAEKMHSDLKGASLGELWAGPQQLRIMLANLGRNWYLPTMV
jgi:hypothetical protein